MTPLSISLLGCGWLGLPLLKSLVADGHRVRGSSRNPDTLKAIQAAGAEAFNIDLPQALPPAFTAGCDVLIFTLPPGGRQLGALAAAQYLEQLSSLGSWLKLPAGPAVIYTSSTGVYGETQGLVTEKTSPRPATHSSTAVLAAEAWLAATGCPLTILRLAGLIAPDRHPGRFYGGRDRPIPQADAPVNLVHRDDVIAAVRLLLGRTDLGSDTYNVCAAAHPTKGDFYAAAAAALGLKIAGRDRGGADGKIISSAKLRAIGWQPGRDDLGFSGSKPPTFSF